MKHFLMAAMLMTGVATFAQTEVKTETAEMARPKREKVTPETQTKQLTEALALDAKQQVKVKALFEQEALAKEALKEQRKTVLDDAAKDELKTKAKQDKEAFKAKMKEILTEEQFATWKTLRAKQPAMGEKAPMKLQNKTGVSKKEQPVPAN